MKKLNYIAPICSTGYGITSVNILKHLIKYYDILLSPISHQLSVDNEEDYNLCNSLLDSSKEIDVNAPCLKIWHQFDLAQRVGKGQYFGFPIFELDTFNIKEKNNLNSTDHLLVCSNWAKSVLKNNNINKPITVIPLGVDTTIFNSETESTPYNNPNYIFLSIGKWEIRKSHDILIETFNKAFNINDNVELWLATSNPFLNSEELQYWTNLVENSKLKSKIKIFNRFNSHHDIARLIQYSNCGIYISRAEGWNLELLETIVMNKPVITTNYSGHTEFCNNDNSLLVNITETELAIDNKWFFGNGNWAKIGPDQKDQIINHMRYCYNNRLLTNNGYLNTKNTFTWENTAKLIQQCIS
jgi:glycosyltransferase involved in cell wall biosynthesis